MEVYKCLKLFFRVSDPFHFDVDPDPDPGSLDPQLGIVDPDPDPRIHLAGIVDLDSNP